MHINASVCLTATSICYNPPNGILAVSACLTATSICTNLLNRFWNYIRPPHGTVTCPRILLTMSSPVTRLSFAPVESTSLWGSVIAAACAMSSGTQ